MQKIRIKYLIFTAFFSLIFIHQALAADIKTTKAIMAAEEFLRSANRSFLGDRRKGADTFFRR